MSYDVSGLGLSGGKKSKRTTYMYVGIALVVIIVVAIGVWFAYYRK